MSCVLQRGNSGDGCDLASTLCKYNLRKGDLFVLSWAMVRRVRRGRISSERLQTTQHISSGAITNCCANCDEPSRSQQWGPDLPFRGNPVMQEVTIWKRHTTEPVS